MNYLILNRLTPTLTILFCDITINALRDFKKVCHHSTLLRLY